ncbi:MAG: hypothetical protein SFT90_03350, partial [Rickettsiales bacterium]|nr:hypothetical protein [Rickettsiales bacterium]
MPQERTIISTQNVATQVNDTISAPVQDVAGGQISNISGAATTTDMSFIGLFSHASLVEQFVMLLLLVASVASWTIIFQKYSLIAKSKQKISLFLNLFWEGRGGKTMEEFYYYAKEKTDNPMSRIFVAGMYECYEKKGKRRPLKRAERA